MIKGTLYVYKQKVDHKVLAKSLYEKREHLVCILNTHITKFPLMSFMNCDFAKKYETFITKQDEFLIIEFVNKKTGLFDNKIILKSKEPGCENEFKLKCISYYSRLQKTINDRLNPKNT